MKYITTQFSKYLDHLKNEITMYTNQSSLWVIKGEIKNSPGNLALHICGNLRHNIGAVIGKTGYKRNRDKEFSENNISTEELLREIQKTTDEIIPIIENLEAERLSETFPDSSHGEKQTINDALVRLAFHMAYHIGQINYHRRILTAD
ncbi:MAG: DUF1572 family protein [Ignavibacteria bacterium]|nr:DUF1572 family protein [Ignavibacteria bacterium]